MSIYDRKLPGTKKYVCGAHTVRWTKNHITLEEIEFLRQQYDTLGEGAIKTLSKIRPNWIGESVDLYELLRDNHSTHSELGQLWRETQEVPDWVDWEQLERGQHFFYRYALANCMGFALQGFVGDNSSSTGAIEVLVKTGGFETAVLPRRLLETFQLLLEVTKSLQSIQPGGAGHTTAVRVRLLHSAVREKIIQHAKANRQYFDAEKFGPPINSLDSVHAIATFCCNHMWLQLPLMGVRPKKKEMEDYIALWRYLAYLMGTPDTYFSDVTKAKACVESLLLHETSVSPTSRTVLGNFLESVRDQPPVYLSTDFIEAGSRVLNGERLCDELGLGEPSWLARSCFQGHCWFVGLLARIQHYSPAIDRALIDYTRRKLHEVIIQGALGGGSKMKFRFLPKPGYSTKHRRIRPVSRRRLHERPLEAFFILVFAIYWPIALICQIATYFSTLAA